MKLSPNFTLEEATMSQEAARRGIDNLSPSHWTVETAKLTACHMETVRSILASPVLVSSWIRCLELNRALRSKDSSQHVKGEAVDFTAPHFGTPLEVCKILLTWKQKIDWDQLILEHTWVHISWNSVPSGTQRGEVLSLLHSGKYAVGLTDSFGNSLTSSRS